MGRFLVSKIYSSQSSKKPNADQFRKKIFIEKMVGISQTHWEGLKIVLPYMSCEESSPYPPPTSPLVLLTPLGCCKCCHLFFGTQNIAATKLVLLLGQTGFCKHLTGVAQTLTTGATGKHTACIPISRVECLACFIRWATLQK